MVKELMTDEERDDLNHMFMALDSANTSILRRSDLVRGFDSICKELKVDTEKEIDDILLKIDADGSGEIEYSEWIVASVNKEQLLSKENLAKAFKIFD